MELGELEVGESRAGPVRGSHPVADGAGRVRRPFPECSCPARGEQRRARRDGTAIRDRADAAVGVRPEVEQPSAFLDADPRVSEHTLGERASDAIPGGRSAGMNDPSPAVASFETEAVVEVDAEIGEIADPRRRLLGQHRDRARPAEAAAGTQRVLRVQLGRVVVSDGGGDAALRKRARGRQNRAFRDEQDLGVGRGAERAEEPGNTSADHEEVDPISVEPIPHACSPVVLHGSFRL